MEKIAIEMHGQYSHQVSDTLYLKAKAEYKLDMDQSTSNALNTIRIAIRNEEFLGGGETLNVVMMLLLKASIRAGASKYREALKLHRKAIEKLQKMPETGNSQKLLANILKEAQICVEMAK